MSKPLVSVIVPVYNGEACIGRCMSSLRSQTCTHLEVLVVDDGSTDATASLVSRFAQKDSRFRLIRHGENRGLSAARNTGVAASRGEWLAFVDHDDWVEADYVAQLLDLAQETGSGMACCNHWIEEANGRSHRCFHRRKKLCLTDRQAVENVLCHRPPDVSTWGKLFRRSLFDGLAYPEGLRYEDTFLIVPLLQAAGRIAWTPLPLYHYTQQPSSITGGGWRADRMQYLTAVEHMTACALSTWPQLRSACQRRLSFAALSVRRYLTDCPEDLLPLRAQLDEQISSLARSVLRYPKTPCRDRVAILVLLAGDEVFDRLWNAYNHFRGR